MYGEFPRYAREPDDLTEVIYYLKKLEEEYEGTLKQITDTNDRLSAYEKNVDARISELRNVIIPNAVNAAVQNAVNSYKAVTDLKIQNLERRVENLNNKISTVENNYKQADAQLLERIQQLAIDTNYKFATITSRINMLDKRLTKEIVAAENRAKAYSDVLNAQMKQYIDTDIAVIMELFYNLPRDGTYVENPVQGLEITSASEAIMDIYNYFAIQHRFSAFEWYMFSHFVTAEQWQQYHCSAIDWHVRAKQIFGFERKTNGIFSGLTGKYISHKQAINEIYGILKQGLATPITAGEYDEKQITAAQYNNMHKEAYDYDWFGIKKGDITNV